MRSKHGKQSPKYPSQIDAWSPILGMCFLFLGLAGILYMVGHAHGGPWDTPNIFVVISVCSFCLGIIFVDIAMMRYIREVYGVSFLRQGFRWRSTNWDQGKWVFYPANLKFSAEVIGFNPTFVLVILYSLLPLIAVVALIFGLVTH
jgi:hypothetical protein